MNNNSMLSDSTEPIYVVTIIISCHGRTTELNLNMEEMDMFTNSRLYQVSQCFGEAAAANAWSMGTYEYLEKQFHRDLSNKSTFDILEDFMYYANPKYNKLNEMISDTDTDKTIGQMYDPITFDKVLHKQRESSMTNIFENNYMGIHVLSVHLVEKNRLQLIYPLNEHKVKRVDLFNIEDINSLREYIHGKDSVDNITGWVKNISNTETFPEKHSKDIREMSYEFGNNSKYTRYIRGNEIIMLRLSFLSEMIKRIFRMPIRTNFLDYSCSTLHPNLINNPSEMSMSKFVSPVHLYPLKEYENKSVDIKQDIDLEKGLSGRSFGGRKRNKKTKRVTRKKRKTKRRSRSRKSRRIRKRK